MKTVLTLVLIMSSVATADLSIEDQLDMIAVLARRANSRPVIDQTTGKVVGYKLHNVEGGSLELKDGDVITGVKGLKVSKPEAAMEMFNQLKRSDSKDIKMKKNQHDGGED